MSTNEERAKAVVEQVKAELPSAWLGGRQHVVLIKAIALALQAERAAVWGEASKYLEENQRMPPHIGPLWNAGWTESAIAFASWCRAQAKEAQR